MLHRIGRYELHHEVAAGGMGVVHLGRLIGPAGFSRTVAIKRMHAHLAADRAFVRMFVDEARLTSRVRHPNVVSVLDVIAENDELLLVMEHIEGVSLSELCRRTTSIPPAIVSAIVMGALLGLHAAHEATDESGERLDIVHLDVSPHNVLVGSDGVARVLDFGVARAATMLQPAQDDSLRGKIAYMAPEQLLRQQVDRRADLHAMGVVLWELLAGRRLFTSKDSEEIAARVLRGSQVPPSQHAEVSAEVDAVCMKALAPRPKDRFATAREMALALSAALPAATAIEVGDFIGQIASDALATRSDLIAAIEDGTLVRTDLSRDIAAYRRASAVAPSEATETDLSMAPRRDTVPEAPQSKATTASESGVRVSETARPPRRPAAALVGAAFVAAGAVLAASVLPGRAADAESWYDERRHGAVALPPAATASSEPVETAAPAPDPPPAAPASAPPLARPSPRPAPPPDPCDPPFTVDARGDKHFKPGCFR